ncbi:MAG TPA: hypothetical protein VHG28_05635 [Longimicrobiaceae bacterium]|nr:hypothetical protein [Longimicrobiaceae bacterium]
MRAPRILTLIFLLAAPALAGCEGVIDPGTGSRLSEDQLIFARADPGAPPLDALVVSFWAKPGQTRSAAIRYVGVTNPKYVLCMEFVVPAGALLQHPDGRRVEAGDSVRITVRALDPEAFRFEFEPSGLRFAPDQPARLRISYWWADRDYNGDGKEDGDDRKIEENLGLWRQERPGELWNRVVAERNESDYEIRANILGFTRYAVASTRSSDRID